MCTEWAEYPCPLLFFRMIYNPYNENPTERIVMNENTTNLMNKNINDLTVKDALKINLAVVAVAVAVPTVISGVDIVKTKLMTWRENRKFAKAQAES